jgi:GxxExxY protein
MIFFWITTNTKDHEDHNEMDAEEIMKIILDEAFYIHKKLGPGLLENVYKTCLAYRLRKRGLYVEVEKPVPVIFEEVRMDCGYRTDLVVGRKVVIDTKNIESIGMIEISQVLTQLRFLELRYGLVLNFRTVYLRDGIRRVINGYDK